MFLYFILQQKCKTGVLLQPQKGFDPASEHNNKMPELFSASFSSSPILELCKKGPSCYHVLFCNTFSQKYYLKHQELWTFCKQVFTLVCLSKVYVKKGSKKLAKNKKCMNIALSIKKVYISTK